MDSVRGRGGAEAKADEGKTNADSGSLDASMGEARKTEELLTERE